MRRLEQRAHEGSSTRAGLIEPLSRPRVSLSALRRLSVGRRIESTQAVFAIWGRLRRLPSAKFR
jgi:hypothetical protein